MFLAVSLVKEMPFRVGMELSELPQARAFKLNKVVPLKHKAHTSSLSISVHSIRNYNTTTRCYTSIAQMYIYYKMTVFFNIITASSMLAQLAKAASKVHLYF